MPDTLTRMPLGRRIAPLRPALQLRDVLTGVLPPVPQRVDNLITLHGGWKMLGNGPDPAVGPHFSGAGNCEAVRVANDIRVITSFFGAEFYPGLEWVWEIYKTQNPGFDPNGDPDIDGPGSSHDNGMATQLLLEYLHTTGTPDGRKVAFFGQVDPHNEAELDAALAIFGRVWLDITVQQAQQGQFNDGLTWQWETNSPTEGGHAVLGGAFGPENKKSAGFITWATETFMTDKYRFHGVESAWVVAWPEQLGSKQFLQGVDAEKLATYFRDLTGRPYSAGA